jgi:hypothetical protein
LKVKTPARLQEIPMVHAGLQNKFEMQLTTFAHKAASQSEDDGVTQFSCVLVVRFIWYVKRLISKLT